MALYEACRDFKVSDLDYDGEEDDIFFDDFCDDFLQTYHETYNFSYLHTNGEEEKDEDYDHYEDENDREDDYQETYESKLFEQDKKSNNSTVGFGELVKRVFGANIETLYQ